jgi:hypothetical protein
MNKSISQVDCAYTADAGHTCATVDEHEVVFRGPLVPQFLYIRTQIVLIEEFSEVKSVQSGGVVLAASARSQ